MSNDSLPPIAESASPPKRWQFRLWHLFALMTYVAVVVATVRWWGTISLPTTLGLGIAWVNYGGALTFLQRGKSQLVTLVVAWGMFLGSLFLPTHTAWAAQGWVAAWGALSEPLDLVRRQEWSDFAQFMCWGFLIDIANLSQILLPLTAIRLRMKHGKFLVFLNCASMTSIWAIALSTAASGYILWCASFLLALTAMPVNRTTLVVMHIMLAGQLAFWWNGGHF